MDDITETRMKIVRRVTGVAAMTAAGGTYFGLLLSYLIIQPVIDVIGEDGYFLASGVGYWLTVAAAALVLVGLGAGWRLVQPRWAYGLVPVVLGLVLEFGWNLIEQHFDVWQLGQFGPDSGGDLKLLLIAQVSAWVGVSVTWVAIALLAYGGFKVLRSPLLLPTPEPAGA